MIKGFLFDRHGDCNEHGEEHAKGCWPAGGAAVLNIAVLKKTFDFKSIEKLVLEVIFVAFFGYLLI